MGIHAAITGSPSITTSTTNIDSQITGQQAYHHIKLFFTGTIQASDRYQIIMFSYDPVAAAYAREYDDEVNFETCGNTSTDADQNKVWEMSPTVGTAVRLAVKKLAGNNRTVNYEIIHIT